MSKRQEMSLAQPTQQSTNQLQPRFYSKAPSKNQDSPTYEYANTGFGFAAPDAIQQPVTKTTVVSAPAAAKKERVCLIVLGIALLLCVTVVALIGVVLYRPTSSGVTAAAMELLMQRVEQLESQFQQVQGFNYSLDKDTLTSLSRAQEAMETDIGELVTSQTLTATQLNTVQSTQAAMGTSIGQLSSFQTSTNSLLTTVQNSLSVISTAQGGIRDDLDHLGSVDLYSGCTSETRTCTLSTSGSSSYYWRSCRTSNIYADNHNQDSSNYVTNIWCDITRNTYMESTYIYRVGDYVYCQCHVTEPGEGTSSTTEGHSVLGTSSYTATCTLTVTKCPRTVNLLS